MQGYVQVYTGDGKGKTTAALGLTLRAVGAGLKVYILQFAKGMAYSELNSLATFGEQVTVRQCGRDCFIHREPKQEDMDLARQGFEEAREALFSGKYDLVILDEANIATYYKLVTVDELLELIEKKPEHVELVITGRKADEKIVARADLVTEMREIKHYYQQGVDARKGIES